MWLFFPNRLNLSTKPIFPHLLPTRDIPEMAGRKEGRGTDRRRRGSRPAEVDQSQAILQDGLLQTGSPEILDNGQQPAGAFVFDKDMGWGRV